MELLELLKKIEDAYINNLPDIKGMERLAITSAVQLNTSMDSANAGTTGYCLMIASTSLTETKTT